MEKPAVLDHSLLLPASSSPSLRLLFYPFCPGIPTVAARRRRLRLRRCRLVAIQSLESDVASVELKPPAVDPAIFGPKKELSGPQVLVDALPPAARIAGSVVLTAAALAAGFGLGTRLGGSRTAGIGGAAVLGVAVGGAAYAVSSSVPEVAAVSLHNLVAGYDVPTALKKDEVEAIEKRYGVGKQDEAFRMELCDLYSRFVTSVLPPGGENLKGKEVETIIKFKEALGIDDPDAASVHMEACFSLVSMQLR